MMSFYLFSGFKRVKKAAAVLLLGALLWSSCTHTVTLQVLQPAEIRIPDYINQVAVIDRSKPQQGWRTVLEGLVSGEEIGQDRSGRRRATEGLIQGLTRTPRFVVRSTGVEMTGSESGARLVTPLDWYEVEQICRQYNADALVAIELFDSNLATSFNPTDTKVKTSDGKEVVKREILANRRLNVRLGWRFYDPKTRTIIDEAVTTRSAESQGRGDTEAAATTQLPPALRITEDISFQAGMAYGERIAPTFINVPREFFTTVKGDYKEQMKRAARYAQANDWYKAAEIWQTIAQRADKKAAGRAAYNVAIANECLGKLQTALEWAQKAYTEFGNTMARDYIQILINRQQDEKLLESQMQGR